LLLTLKWMIFAIFRLAANVNRNTATVVVSDGETARH
jgi:hypothetical protein